MLDKRLRGNSSVVEHNLAKVGVASSNLVSRSIDSLRIRVTLQFNCFYLMCGESLGVAGWQSGYAAACKAVDAGSIPTLASNQLS